MFNRAETELSIAFRDARQEFESWEGYRSAIREEQVAYDELNLSRRKAFAGLARDAKYQRLVALWQDMAEQIAERRTARPTDQAEIIAMAKVKLSYAVEMRSIEADVLNADGGQVRAALERLVAAGARIAALRHQYDQWLRTNPVIVAARRDLEDARIARLTADAYLQGSIAASEAALDYSYYTHRHWGYNANDYGYRTPFVLGARY